MKRYVVLVTLFIVLSMSAIADYLGSFNIDDTVTITAATHRFSNGAAYAADSAPILYVYKDDETSQIVDSTLTSFAGITGLYARKVTLSAANGFTVGSHYTVLIQATVDSVSGITTHNFQIPAAANASAVADAVWAKMMVDLEPGAPPYDADALTALNYLYELMRNRTETTSSKISVFKDDGLTKLMEADISDDGTTFIRTKYNAED